MSQVKIKRKPDTHYDTVNIEDYEITIDGKKLTEMFNRIMSIDLNFSAEHHTPVLTIKLLPSIEEIDVNAEINIEITEVDN